jgi:hypothetical protein
MSNLVNMYALDREPARELARIVTSRAWAIFFSSKHFTRLGSTRIFMSRVWAKSGLLKLDKLICSPRRRDHLFWKKLTNLIIKLTTSKIRQINKIRYCWPFEDNVIAFDFKYFFELRCGHRGRLEYSNVHNLNIGRNNWRYRLQPEFSLRK